MGRFGSSSGQCCFGLSLPRLSKRFSRDSDTADHWSHPESSGSSSASSLKVTVPHASFSTHSSSPPSTYPKQLHLLHGDRNIMSLSKTPAFTRPTQTSLLSSTHSSADAAFPFGQIKNTLNLVLLLLQYSPSHSLPLSQLLMQKPRSRPPHPTPT